MNRIYLDYFYNFKKVEGKKTAFTLVKSTGKYEPFEIRRNKKGQLRCYFCDADYTKEIVNRKERWKMSLPGFHVSKVRAIISDFKKAFGDVNTTSDALYFVFKEDIRGFTDVKVFIAKGKKNDYALIAMFIEGDFDEEMKSLEDEAQDE